MSFQSKSEPFHRLSKAIQAVTRASCPRAIYPIIQKLLSTGKADRFDIKRLCKTLSKSQRLIEVRITTFRSYRSSPEVDTITDSILECFEILRGVENVVFPMSCGVETTDRHEVSMFTGAITGTDKAREKARRIMTSRE